MDYREEEGFFIEYHRKRNTLDPEFNNPGVHGERSPYQYMFHELIPSADFRPERFPAGCTDFQIRREVKIFVDGNHVNSRYSNVTEKIPVENPIPEPITSSFD